MNPEHLRYTSEHEWALVTESGSIRFGITDHAQSALGDIVFVTLPELGTVLSVGESCGEIESTKSVADVFAPVAGTVIARNDAVETAPETVNGDPYGAGWLLEVEPSDPDSLGSLLSATDYEALISAE
ncbi:MAG: glycine cleavage system protein GcvH [Actinomycetes bacterium]